MKTKVCFVHALSHTTHFCAITKPSMHVQYSSRICFQKSAFPKILLLSESTAVFHESRCSHSWAHHDTSRSQVEIICTWSWPLTLVSVGSLAIIQIIKSIFVMLKIKVGAKPSSDSLLTRWVHESTHLHSHSKTMQVVKWPVKNDAMWQILYYKRYGEKTAFIWHVSQLIDQNSCRCFCS